MSWPDAFATVAVFAVVFGYLAWLAYLERRGGS